MGEQAKARIGSVSRGSNEYDASAEETNEIWSIKAGWDPVGSTGIHD